MQRLVSFLTAAVMSLPVMACSSEEGPSKPNIKPAPGGDGETGPSTIKVGEVLPAWKEGVMDIHFINTTTGESAFVIMPAHPACLQQAVMPALVRESVQH